ncbi:MAG TPA: nitrate/sulfonate/bicarbonate ABC transporter ATP-binding protein [Bryobacteraceae bacterium]|nr:nitrate/sulfonate/bicarbonate ABC transporter ATP-binding protein [Bryobacteraceae bacterium]
MVNGQSLIEARAVEKFYPAPDGHRIQVIAPLDITVHSGQILALLGPSGSGKSTLLRMLTGLSKPSSGEIKWNGLGTRPSNLAIVFQSFALFPWLTVQENVEAPLEARGVMAEERAERSRKALDVVGLDGFEAAYPKELSGGMKQRVGFARALVVEPQVLFMDEPFSALDVLTAENLRNQVIELWMERKLSTQAIFIVTHNIEEAVLLADRVIVLGKNPARIRGDFEVALDQPRDRKSHQFLRYVDYIYQTLTRPDSEQPLHVGGPPSERQIAKHEMLPHVRPGGIAGLLEMLPQDGSRIDLYRLAEDLGLEVDDILPIVDGGVLLGFVSLVEGDVEMTDSGRRFADADILTQKELFRDAALKAVPLLDQIRRAVAAKSDHRVTDEFFRDLLDEYFTEEEVQRQLETVIAWGRYAELFDYDAGQKRFFLSEPDPAADENGARA